MKRIVWLLVLLGPAPAFVVAQDAGEAAPPCRPAAAGALAVLAGAWTVDWTYRTAPETFETSEAVARITEDLHGCVLVEHFEGTLRGVPFSSITLFSASPDGALNRVRVDSEHGAFTAYTGRAAGDTLVFDWQRDLGDRIMRTRHRYVATAPDTLEVTFYLSRADGSPWERVQHAVYRRRP